MLSFPFPLKMKPVESPSAGAPLVKPVDPVPAVTPSELAAEVPHPAAKQWPSASVKTRAS